MTIEQVEKRIDDLCKNEPDNTVGIRYWVGYRDGLASAKPEMLKAAIAGQETLQREILRWQEMYKAAAAERDANMKRVIELERRVGA